MSIAIREIGIGDESMVHEMLDAVSPGWVDQLAPGASGPRAFVATNNSFMFCAYVDNEPAGFVWGSTIRRPTGGVMSLVYELDVRESFRRQGIGSMLMEAANALARREEHVELWLVTENDNDEARGLYENLGAQSNDTPDRVYWWDLS